MSRKTILIVAVFCLHFLGGSIAREMPAADREFKERNLASLQPLGPIYNEALSEKWRELIRIAAENADRQIAEKFFSLATLADGSIAEQCHLALFELYKRNAQFFIEAANEHFHGDLQKVLLAWINEVDDIHLDEIEKYGSTASPTEIVRGFMKAAAMRSQEYNSELEKNNSRVDQSKNEFQKGIKNIIKWHQ